MAEHEPEAAVKSGKSGMIVRLTVLAFMLAVIGGECLIACFYLPTVAASASSAPAADDHGQAKPDAHSGEHPASPPALQREVDLGQFNLTAFQPASNTTLLIDFHLYGTVPMLHEEEAAAAPAGHGGHGSDKHGGGEAKSKDEFASLFDKHKHRIRDQIITIVRSAEMTDFADPSLGLLRRKILEKSNRALGKPLLEEVFFSDFSLVEQ